MPTWPASLPVKALVRGYDEGVLAQFEEKPTNEGPPKRRATTTMETEELSVAYRLTVAQKDTLKAFFKDDLKRGTLGFIYQHPTEGIPVTAYLMGKKLSFRPAGRGQFWEVALQLRILL